MVEAVGVASGRSGDDGEPLDAVLITRHLPFSLPYRVLFARQAVHELRVPMLDALAQLFVQLHLNGFFWGDCSLSNTLFRRDAGALRAFLVDAETGEQHPSLSDGQRAHDLLIAEENIAGELMDLAARSQPEGEELVGVDEALAVGEDLVRRYEGLWAEVTRDEVVGVDEQHRIAERVTRLNELGFDVEELELVGSGDQLVVRVQTCVVEPGHHRRRLLSLTGIDAGENQARVLLNDILRFRLWLERTAGVPVAESVGAVRWLVEVYEPTVAAVPGSLTARLEPPELFHQILEHRWFLSEQRRPGGRDRRGRRRLRRQRPAAAARGSPGAARPADPARADHRRRVTRPLTRSRAGLRPAGSRAGRPRDVTNPSSDRLSRPEAAR